MTLPTLTFEAVPHTYALNGVYVPSVTHVIKPVQSLPPEFLRDAAMERGRIVHDAIHADNTHDLDEHRFALDHRDKLPYLAAWRDFRTLRNFRPVFNEYRVASPRHLVAGTIDALGILDNHAAIVDYKTGDPAALATDLQLAGYLTLAVEWANAGDTALADFFKRFPIIRRYGVRLRPDGTFRVEHYTDRADFRDFLALVASWHIIANRRRRPLTEAA